MKFDTKYYKFACFYKPRMEFKNVPCSCFSIGTELRICTRNSNRVIAYLLIFLLIKVQLFYEYT